MPVKRDPLPKKFWTIYLKLWLQILICNLWMKLLNNLLLNIKLMICNLKIVEETENGNPNELADEEVHILFRD